MPQKTCLINDTIINNISLDARSKINHKKLLKCLRDSELYSDLKINKISLQKKLVKMELTYLRVKDKGYLWQELYIIIDKS